ncbi:MAG: hypothetical protein AAGC67_21145 [Myxococcota bacterium]
MTNPFFQLGAAFAGLVVFSFMALEGKDVAQELGLVEEDEPVLVFEIPHPDHLASVRKAIADERVLDEGAGGFSVRSGRVYVQDVGEAGAFIARGGWVDQPVQIVGLGMDREEEGEREGGPPAMTPEERRARLFELVKKPTLTRGEQMFVLAAMNDGIEI